MDLSSQILSDITVHMKYARYLPSLQRRETWEEIVTRNKSMHIAKYPQLKDEIESVYKLVYDKKVLPSMRALQFSGKPIELSPNRQFNCVALAMDHPYAFGEVMFLLLGGSGVGISVQKHHIDKLPEIKKPRKYKRFLVDDSISGWSQAVEALMKSYFRGTTCPKFDFSDIRAKGMSLITSGGKAPGPEPLKECLIQIKAILDAKEDREKLTPLEVHDIICHISDSVLSGGIRRSALISIFSFDDEEMLKAKAIFHPQSLILSAVYPPANGGEVQYHLQYSYRKQKFIKIVSQSELLKYGFDKLIKNFPPSDGVNESLKVNKVTFTTNGKIPIGWWEFAPYRARANNSAMILRHKIKKKEFQKFWKTIEESKAGEPGFLFSNDKEWLTNPCAEIALRSNQGCNLTTINISSVESQEDFNQRTRAASFIGTLQAGYTDFHYLRDVWKTTTDKEALLGVSMTGIAGSKVFDLNIEEAVECARLENERIAKLIGINKAARITTVKPEGTASLVLGTSSGVHAWHDKYYIRRIRLLKNEPLYTYLSIHHPELLEDDEFKPDVLSIISIPQKAPDNAILRTESAINLLERVKTLHNRWIKPGHISGSNTHNVSATISIKHDEWDTVGEWMWNNRDYYNALSVLPYDDHVYVQAPFESCSKQKYEKLTASLKKIDLSKVIEINDNTNLVQELACAGNSCELV